jgi:hypothetical protein
MTWDLGNPGFIHLIYSVLSITARFKTILSVLWVSKGQRVSKCSFLRDCSIPLPDLVLNPTKVTYMDNFAQII